MELQPTRAELADRFGAFARVEGRRDLIAAGLLLAALLARGPLLRWTSGTPASGIMAASLYAILAGMIVYKARSIARYRAAEVCCPSCGAVFARAAERQFVVTHGNCIRCSAAITRDAELDASAAGERGRDNALRWLLVVLVLFVVLVLGHESGMWVEAFGKQRPVDMPYVHAIGPPVGITVQDAAARIAAVKGRPSIVILYGLHSPCVLGMFSAFAAMAYRHPEAEVLAFSSEESTAAELPAFLRQHRADFDPLYLHDWPDGDLARAMAPLGIKVDSIWLVPLVAIRDANGVVVMQGDAMKDVRAMERALTRMRRR